MKLCIGFITYEQSSFKYLNIFLRSLLLASKKAKSAYQNLEIVFLAFDNSELSNDNNILFSQFFSDNNCDYKKWINSQNIGFSKAYNIMINWSLSQGADLFLMLNPDVLLLEDCIEKLINTSIKKKSYAVWSPRIMYWDFDNNKKSDIIDSYGLGISPAHRFFDKGQGKKESEYNIEEEIFGFTGAGALLNLKNLVKVAYNKKDGLEFFDEMMFMYKEDVDLSYRLQLSGQRIALVSDALIYHHRSLSDNKMKRLKNIFLFKKNISESRSFLNHLIILFKIRKLPFSWRVKFYSYLRLIFLLFYALILERVYFFEFLKLRNKIDEKANNLSYNNKEISFLEKLMKWS